MVRPGPATSRRVFGSKEMTCAGGRGHDGEAGTRHQHTRIRIEGDDLDRGGEHDGEAGTCHEQTRIRIEGDDLDGRG